MTDPISTLDDVATKIMTGVTDAFDLAVQFLHRTHAADSSPAPIEFDDHGWASGSGVTVFRKINQVAPSYAQDEETSKQQTLAPGLEHVEGIVAHYTDTRGCGARVLAQRLLDPMNKRAASWHACIDRSGDISQSVSAKCGSWHAGGATAALFTREDAKSAVWSPLTSAQRGNVRGWSANSWAFGVELENAGELRLVDGKWCSWPFAFGTKYGAPVVVPEAEVVVDTARPTRGWHGFTDAQVTGMTRLVAGLAGRYGLLRANCEWTHAEIDPQNRVDPGPVWFDLKSRTGLMKTVLDTVFGPR